MKEHPDLIFSDACTQLFPVETDIMEYLGNDVLEMIHKTDPRICNEAINNKKSNIIILFTSMLISSIILLR